MSPVVHRGNPDVLRRAPHGGDHVPRAGAALAALGVARPRARRPAAVHRTRCARRGGREPDAGRIVVADGRCPRSGPERLEASCGEAVRGVHERAADPGPGCAVVIADAGHRCGLEVDEADRTRHQAPDRIDVGRRIRRPTLRHESTDGTASTRSRIRVGRRRFESRYRRPPNRGIGACSPRSDAARIAGAQGSRRPSAHRPGWQRRGADRSRRRECRRGAASFRPTWLR